ncbi:MAG: hypothetical protein K8S98_17525 [Planctomycetes bacterium]|nr:hypothetical protein [Planctomycetota bacterium]
MSLARIVLLLFVTASAAFAQVPNCKVCGGSGREPCAKHAKVECPLEDSVRFCSFVAKCADCGGAGFVACKKCAGEAVLKTLAKKRERVALEAEKLASYDETMGRPLRKGSTDHFTLVFELDDLKVEKRLLHSHELLHLYLQRLEALYADYVTLLDARHADFRERFQVFVWYLDPDQMKASLAFCEQGAPAGVKLMGAHPRFSTCANKRWFTTDEQLHRDLLHMVSHLILSHEEPQAWMGNQKGGWAEEGLGHWFEYRGFQRCDNYCFQEQNTNNDYKGGDYKLLCRKLVATDDAPAIASVFERNTDTLLRDEHVVAFSYVDYLLSLDGAKFGKLCADLRRKVPTREALQKHFGLGPLEFERRWKEWVLATYPTQKD